MSLLKFPEIFSQTKLQCGFATPQSQCSEPRKAPCLSLSLQNVFTRIYGLNIFLRIIILHSRNRSSVCKRRNEFLAESEFILSRGAVDCLRVWGGLDGGNRMGQHVGVQYSLFVGRLQLGWWDPVGLGLRGTWVLISSLLCISCEIVHSFKTGHILGIKTTKLTPKT